MVRGYPRYAFLFLCLTITSLLVHMKGIDRDHYIIINIIDKICILSLFVIGMYILHGKIEKNRKSYNVLRYGMLGCIFMSLLLVFYLYIYGFYTDQFCFSDMDSVREGWHIIMHLVGSIGHHFIIAL